ncbi:hypothetical protein Hypma_012371 [Hypsizygus marmoreus]|uniref:F-box domain-containing protein n=1 Tax=Hypsizygus marmoreus TaxID=39966 RepID=A0A369K8E3_HYPMA|nr:hypothetical protein Hypma_012371 [Hypsizygus marmoreus]
MPFPSQFSPEIMDDVVDHLSDDTFALKHCSLVSQTFRPRSQMHLYSTIEIDFTRSRRHGHKHPLWSFLNVLTPRLAYCIRNLSIVNYAEDVQNGGGEFGRREEHAFPLLFKQLHTLYSFRLLVEDDYDYGSAPTKLSSSVTSALLAMIESTKVVELTLTNLGDFPVDKLTLHCPYLKRLMLRLNGEVKDEDVLVQARFPPMMIPQETTAEKGHLETLEINVVSNSHLGILYATSKLPESRITLSHLRELSIAGHCLSTALLVSSIMADAIDTLEQFTWAYEADFLLDDFGSDEMARAFPPNPLSLKVSFRHWHDEEPLHLFWLYTGLKNTRRPCNRLEDIVILLTINPYADLIYTDFWINCYSWASSIDALLAGPEYLNLRQVAIFVEYSSLSGKQRLPISYLEVLSMQLKEKLLLLLEKGVLSVQWMLVEENVADRDLLQAVL